MDRGMIKWQPFNSCVSTQDMVKEIIKEKNKLELPILSDDQIKIIEEKVIDAFNLKIIIKIEYYYDGLIKKETGKIYSINWQQKKIYLNNKALQVLLGSKNLSFIDK